MDNKKDLLPNEYFTDLKTKFNKIDLESLDSDIKLITNLIEDAKEIGQKTLAQNYEDLAITFFKERLLFKHDYTKYVKKDDIAKYIKSVKNHVIKICELEAFPRTLPQDVKTKLREAKSLNVFDDFWVVFIDWEDKENITEEEKEIRAKNRDPILFGTIKECMDRFYFIIDWEDDICDLRFEDMVKGLQKLDKKYKVCEIVKDSEQYINILINERNKKPFSITQKVKNIWKGLFKK